eukprot:tig00020824_g14231.t1
MRGQISDPTTPFAQNGSLAINVTMSTYGSVSLSAFWSESVDDGQAQIPSTYNVTVLDGRASCSPSRIAVGSNVSCVVLPTPGSADLVPEDVKPAPVPGGYIASGDLVPINGSITFSALAVEAKDAVPVSVSWSDGLDGGELAAQLVDVIRANLSCLPRAREGYATPCLLARIGQSPALESTDFKTPVTSIPSAASFGGYSVSADGLGGQDFTFTPAWLRSSATIAVSYDDAVQPTWPDVQVDSSPATVVYVGGALSTSTARVAVNTTASFSIEAKVNGSKLELSDIDPLSFDPDVVGDSGERLSEDVTNSGLAYTYRLAAPGLATISAAYASIIGGGAVDGAPLVSVLSASLTCSSSRAAVGSVITCNIARVGASPEFLASELVLAVSPSSVATVSALENSTDPDYQFTFTVSIGSAVEDASISVTYAASIDVDTRNIAGSPHAFVAIALTVDDFEALSVAPTGVGILSALSETDDGAGNVFFTYRATDPTTSQTVFDVHYAAAIDPSTMAVPRDVPAAAVVLSATIHCTPDRLAIRAPFTCTLAPGNDTWPVLEPTDFAPLAISPAGAQFSAISSISDGKVNFDVAVTAQSLYPNLTIFWGSTVHDLPDILAVPPTPLTVLSANVSCSSSRQTVGATISCEIESLDTSPKLELQEFTISIEPPVGEISAAIESNATSSSSRRRHILETSGLYTFTIKITNLTDGARISVRYAAAIDPEQKVLQDEALPLVSIGGDLTCWNLRRRLGAITECEVKKLNGSADLLPSDVNRLPCAAGKYTDISTVSGGGLSFTLIADAVTSDEGESLVVQYAPAVDPTEAQLGPAFNVVVINAAFACTKSRIAAYSAFNCSVTAPPSSASTPTLLLSDFDSEAPSAPLGYVVGPSWARTADNTFTRQFTGAVASSTVLHLRWAESVGGGGANVTVDVVEARIVCPARRAVGATAACLLERLGASPALQASDFAAPVAAPAGFGTFGALIVDASGNVALPYTTSSLTPATEITVVYSSAVDDRSAPVNGSGISIATLGAGFSCPQRRAVGSAILCTLVAASGSAQFQDGDLLAASYEPAASIAEAIVSVNGSSAVLSAKLVASALSVRVTPRWSAALATDDLVAMSSVAASVGVVDATLKCDNSASMEYGSSIACYAEPVAPSEILLADFQAPSLVMAAKYVTMTALAPASDGRFVFTLTGQRITEENIATVGISYTEAIDPFASPVRGSPMRFYVNRVTSAEGAMSVVSARFANDGYEISIVFSIASLSSTATVPASAYFSEESVAALGQFSTCSWTSANTLTCQTSADATLLPKSGIVVSVPILAADGSGRSFTGPVVIDEPLVPLIPSLSVDAAPSIPSCRPIIALAPSTVDLTRPTLAIPRGTLPPGESFTLTMTATDQKQNPPTKSTISVEVVVLEQQLQAVITGGDRVVPPFDPLELSAGSSRDPDYEDGSAAPGTASKLSYTWTALDASGKAVYTSPRSTDPSLSVTPSDAGLQQGTAYTLVLFVEAERAGVLPSLSYANATASTVLRVGAGSTPVVQITSTRPADTLFATKFPIQIRCQAHQTGNANSDRDMVFAWSAPNGEPELANISTLASRSIQDSNSVSTLSLTEKSGIELKADRIYIIRCSAYTQAGGIAFAGPKPGDCSVDPLAGIALETPFVVTCSGWTTSYSSEATLRYQLKMVSSGGELVTITQPQPPAVMRTTLPANEGGTGNLTLVIVVVDEFGSETEHRTNVAVRSQLLEALAGSLAAGDETKTQQLAKDSIATLLKQAGSAIAATEGDGDREGMIGATVNAALMVANVMNKAFATSKDPTVALTKIDDADGTIQSLLAPLIKAVKKITSSNDTTKGEIFQTMSAVSVLAEVVVRTSTQDVQAQLAELLRILVDTLHDCTYLDEAKGMIMKTTDAFVGSPDWTRLSGIVQGILDRFIERALSCTACGTGDEMASSKRITLVFGRVCFSTASASNTMAINTNGEGGQVSIPSELQALAQKTLGKTTDGLPFKFSTFKRNPFEDSINVNSSASYNMSRRAGVVDMEIPGFPVSGLSERIRFRFLLSNGTAPELPLDLVFFNKTAGTWQRCSNVTIEIRGTAYYGIGSCDHLTPFTVGAPPAGTDVLQAPIRGEIVASSQNSEIPASSSVNLGAAIAVPVVLGMLAIVAVSVFVVYRHIKKRVHMVPPGGFVPVVPGAAEGWRQRALSPRGGAPVGAYAVEPDIEGGHAYGRGSTAALSGPYAAPQQARRQPLHIVV